MRTKSSVIVAIQRAAYTAFFAVVVAWPCLGRAQENVQKLIQQLTSNSERDKNKRPQTRERLVKFGKAALPELYKLLLQEDANVRINAVIALGRIGSVEALKYLTKALEDPDFGVRYRAILAIGEVCSPRPGAAVGNWRPEFVTPVNRVFGILFSLPRTHETRAASKCLARVFGRADPFGVRDIEKTPDAKAKELVRADWKSWMGKNRARFSLREEPPVKELLARMQTGTPEQQAAAAQQLAERKDSAYIRTILEAAKKTKDEKALRSIVKALEDISGIPVGPWRDRAELLKRLAGFELWYNAQRYVTALRSSDPKKRAESVKALGAIDHPNVLPTLIEQLKVESDPAVLAQIHNALKNRVGEVPAVAFFLAPEDRAKWVDPWHKWLSVKDQVPRLASNDLGEIRKAIETLTPVNYYKVIDAFVTRLQKVTSRDQARLLSQGLSALRPSYRIPIYGDTELNEIKRHVETYRAQWHAVRDVMLIEPLLQRLPVLMKNPKLFTLCVRHMSELTGHKPKVRTKDKSKIIAAWQQWLKKRKKDAGIGG